MSANRLLATLIHLRHGGHPRRAGLLFDVDRSSIIRAVGEMRPLLAERGCTVSPDARLRSSADVVDHLAVSGRSPSSTAPRSGSVGPPPGAKRATRSSPARTSRTPSKPMAVTDAEGL
ncbi:transposase family protein [Streptomyces sp. NPDC059459]|uniref:transposase family protein n=1 Tax=Streptomyces sp. NPDC059459 TaxID=3346839 RepID=UPI0036AD453F